MSSNSANVQLKLSNTNLCAPGILAEVHRRRSSTRSGIDVPNENTLLTDGQRKISSVNLCAPGLLGEHLNRRRSSARSALDLPNEQSCAVCRGHRNSTASSLSHVSVHCTDNAKASVIIATAPAAASISSHSPALPALCHLVMRHQYKTYPQRWFVLATVCLLALSNATQWISFAPLHDATDAFYCRGSGTDHHSSAHQNSSAPLPPHRNESKDQCDVEYWTSQIFQIVGVLTGIFGMYITDRYGIRISCLCGCVLNFIGAVIRVISSMPQIPPEYRLRILYTGQTVAATSQPFFLCLSPKVAEYWFSDNQRALANALSFIANPFGVVVGSVAPAIFVTKNPTSGDSNEIFLLNSSLLVLATLVVLMSFGVRTSRPPTPPSASSDCEHVPEFFEGLGILLRTPMFYAQMITFGMALALQWSIFITADKVLSELGYLDKVTAYLLALSAMSGSVASILAGYFVDKTKMFKETIKSAYIGIAFIAIIVNIFLRRPKQSDLDTFVLVVLVIMLGFFAIPVFPISLELGVETTFPVAEATSSGILIIAGQLLLFLTTFVMQELESSSWIYGAEKAANAQNYQLSIDFWTLSAIFAAIFSCLFLWPRYHRLEYEENVTFFGKATPTIEVTIT